MLNYLKVKGFALVDEVEVEFREGFNTLTGETGAGKTVLVEALGLLLGDRADGSMIRHGADAAELACAFEVSRLPRVREQLALLGLLDEEEKELLMSRTIHREKKSRCTINGRLCPLSTLSRAGEMLVDVHGQNAHQALFDSTVHLQYLDNFAGEEHLAGLAEYGRHHRELVELLKERKRLMAESGYAEGESELLRTEIEEIDMADPRQGELESLETEASRLRNVGKLGELATRAEELLSSDESSSFSAREALSEILRCLNEMSSRDESIAAEIQRVESLLLEVEDIACLLSGYRAGLETDPMRLEEIESRISILRRLKRKYGGSLEDVLHYREEASRKLEGFDSARRRLRAIDRDIEEAHGKVARHARELEEERIHAARRLEEATLEQMSQLELQEARFEVSVATREKREGEDSSGPEPYGPRGANDVEFMFSPSASEPLRPLRRIASGGEMSRVMLALKIVLAGADCIPSLVFDEVDAGIGGETARAVGQKLFQLTGFHQVMCVTHLPQIAAYADWQYLVFKERKGQRVRTKARLLDSEERVEEICRMMGDSSGREVTRKHALDILRRASEAKEAISS